MIGDILRLAAKELRSCLLPLFFGELVQKLLSKKNRNNCLNGLVFLMIGGILRLAAKELLSCLLPLFFREAGSETSFKKKSKEFFKLACFSDDRWYIKAW